MCRVKRILCTPESIGNYGVLLFHQPRLNPFTNLLLARHSSERHMLNYAHT